MINFDDYANENKTIHNSFWYRMQFHWIEKFYYIIKIMTINDKIRDEKIQYNINREAAK